MLKKHQVAPAFSAKNQLDQWVNLTDYQNKKNVVLYFYPKDDTPGCTIEANQFTELVNEFAKVETVIMGVSKDSCASHQAFIDKYHLKIDLLADTDGKLCEDYGVWQEREKNGVKSMAILRSTFIIDKAGNLVEAMYAVSPEGHAQDVLSQVQNLYS